MSDENGIGKGKGKVSVKHLSQRVEGCQEPEAKKLNLDEFSQALSRIAVAQVCQSLGFQSFQQSALDTLADVTVRYIREIGKTACLYSNLANRSQCNVYDVILGLEDLGSIQGFSGAPDVCHSISGSGVVKDIIRYVGKTKKIPFAYYLISVLPSVKKRKLGHNFGRVEGKPYNGHIPSWLPKFSNPESYEDISLAEDKDSKIMPMQNMPQKPLHNGYHQLVGVEHVGAEQAKHAPENNPFPVELLEEDGVYHHNYKVMENMDSFLKTNELGRSHSCEQKDRGKIVLNGRPMVHFKVGNSKKHWSTLTNPQNMVIAKLSPWFDDSGDENDVKEGRAVKLAAATLMHLHREKILSENAENLLEATHL